MSQVLDFLKTAEKYCCGYGGFSWKVVNYSASTALRLAIRSRMWWERDDVAAIRKWRDKGVISAMFDERDYSIACKENLSAAISYERCIGRKPFRCSWDGCGFYVAPKFRLFVGIKFWWLVKGQPAALTVTSFKDAEHLMACAYDYIDYEETLRAKITRRVTISRAELSAFGKKVTEAEKARAER